MRKNLLILLLAAGIAVAFVATGLQAGTNVPDTFKMKTPEYKKRLKAPPMYKSIEFTHKKHINDYNISCGECHHDDKGKPLHLKAGDNVQRCVECHNKMEKNKKKRKDIYVHQNAIHTNCVGCHKQANIKAGDPKGRKGPAPITCGKCHVKSK